jgi:elongation factor Ts
LHVYVHTTSRPTGRQAEGVNGDLQKAFEWLRKKGQATVMKNNRAANEGLVGVAVEGGTGVLVEVNSETDFVARNADFQSFVKGLAATVLQQATAANPTSSTELDVGALLKAAGPGGAPLEQELADLVAKIRENISLRRAACLALPPGEGVVVPYVHNALNPALGGAAGLVAIRTDVQGAEKRAAVELFGKRLAMHVVAAKPRFLSPAAVPPAVVAYEKGLIEAQAAGSGKPANIVAKMTEGRLRKFLGEISLLEQPHMIEEGNPRVAEVAAALGKALGGCRVEVAGFVRYKTGEVEELKGGQPDK